MDKLVGSMVLLGVWAAAGCGGRATPITYDWDRSPSALVASYGLAGGNVGSVQRFGEAAYGDPLIRLMGDGTLDYGEPTAVKRRKLDEQQMQNLFNKLRPDRFSEYKDEYYYAMATDMPTATLTVDVKVFGEHSVGVYGLETTEEPDRDDVPADLLAAYAALKAERQGGADVTPTALYLGAQLIDLSQYPQIDAGKVPAWPLLAVDLATTSIYRTPPRALRLEHAAQVAAVLPLLRDKTTPSLPGSKLFTHAGHAYQVAWVVVLP
jgi:hypothetical protein